MLSVHSAKRWELNLHQLGVTLLHSRVAGQSQAGLGAEPSRREDGPSSGFSLRDASVRRPPFHRALVISPAGPCATVSPECSQALRGVGDAQRGHVCVSVMVLQVSFSAWTSS